MSGKRPSSPGLIPNPFIKKRNLEWTLTPPHAALPTAPLLPVDPSPSPSPTNGSPPTTAATESGSAEIDNHLTHFTTHLASHIVPSSRPPALPIPSYASLYTAAAGNAHGAHFVIHQHDHPIAGNHYDLRLQINETSSASWAIMYGLPGDPNSIRLNRNATETRVHCLWNHLIETASSATGSLLIWDTGTYTILPRKSKHAPSSDPSSPASSPPPSPGPHPAATPPPKTPQDLLHAAFQNRKIRIRLHGSRLPDPYVLNLRLTKSEDAAGRTKGAGTRTTRRRRARKSELQPQLETSDDEDDDEAVGDNAEDVPSGTDEPAHGEDLSLMERDIREIEDEHVRRTNSYLGAKNTIGSVHQRRWYLSLDRRACGFVQSRTKGRSRWKLEQGPGSNSHDGDMPILSTSNCTDDTSIDHGRLHFPFYVRGTDHERSVVTGRRGVDILENEGVNNFTPRKGWAPVLS
ncbi:DNA polymerase ligase-domain-containing protein [Dactylonectria estremocensis]|uniref:DNA polymerase ligase-domain-containing protein n=1 Tax=Dactylonectria estremocensis TaxID=1079267 RepID=A0A9P9F789_9HYPO|nr:DNA polymerase ligase-domain-containing protein [Dactylonectria estremocensis]